MPRVHTIDGARRRHKPLGALMTERGCYVNRDSIQDVLKCASACGLYGMIEHWRGSRKDFPKKVVRGPRGTAIFWFKKPPHIRGRKYKVVLYEPTCSVVTIGSASTIKAAKACAQDAASFLRGGSFDPSWRGCME